jgi:hypothetical protein
MPTISTGLHKAYSVLGITKTVSFIMYLVTEHLQDIFSKKIRSVTNEKNSAHQSQGVRK